MKPSWGIGIVVVVLLAAAAALLGVVSLQGAVSTALLLAGIWTIVAAFAIEEKKDRSFYAGWGVIIAGLSLSYVLPLRYALALILIAVVILILITVYYGKAERVYSAARSPRAPAGDTPAATAFTQARSRP